MRSSTQTDSKPRASSVCSQFRHLARLIDLAVRVFNLHSAGQVSFD
jgi:hypothetical protein